tara:strand:+ start:751 stop:1674 length:924 start_codon:yes stop_codon:yes gene_type:complete
MAIVYSLVIPVYKSELIIEKTISRIIGFSELKGFKIELVLVNDGSPDKSWSIIETAAQNDSRIKAINLLKNYGQHTAVYCGIKESMGDFIITMDDDLQNPPEELHHLIEKIHEGYDLVFAEFNQKMHAGFRKLGTRLVSYLNNKIFGKPKDLKLTNFRIFTRATANRLIAYKTNYPYIPGLLLMSASKMANVKTEHHAREIGSSNYTLMRILKLMARLLFNYSSYPLKMVSGAGIFISVMSFFAGLFFIAKSVFLGVDVEGWTTIVALLSFLCGFILIMLGIMGEYLARIMNQLASSEPYQIREIVG